MSTLAPPSLGRRAVDLGQAEPAKYAGAERRNGAARRVDLRARSLMTGKVIVGDCQMSVDCIIRNLSQRGARITIPRGIDLPALVGLMIVREGVYCEAAVAWRKGDQTGLAFRTRHNLKTDTDPARRGVRALWSALVF
ncbi:MAG TPA: PilZ domain-containing protein [Caulobacteraceae bacterium]|nr:PilZ domain-containing protein [Caulobacteraceae bacterium]